MQNVAAFIMLSLFGQGLASTFTIVNNCKTTVSVCGNYLAFAFNLNAGQSRIVAATGNPAYNQCGSVQAERE